jgi:uroporphyrinogen decarboxylase
LKGEKMNSKERVYKTIKHETTDKIPLYIWYHPDILKSLESEFNCSGKDLEVKLGNDILQTWVSINYFQSQVLKEGEIYLDEYGIKWERLGGYNMITENPMLNANIDDLSDYKFPDPFRSDRYDILKGLLDKYGKEKFVGSDVSGTIFEPCSAIRGMEQLLLDLSMEPEKVEPFLDNAMNFSLQVAKNSLELGVDWIWLGDDLGTQTNMIISPNMWRTYFKPRMIHIIKELRKIKPDLIMAYHSCGYIEQILPDLVEMGYDVLNPIQPKSMDMYEIKRKYGSKITMHCGIDTQEILPFSSKDILEKELKKIIKELGTGYGFIFTASHTIQPDTSNDRIIMMLDILKKYGNYPINL